MEIRFGDDECARIYKVPFTESNPHDYLFLCLPEGGEVGFRSDSNGGSYQLLPKSESDRIINRVDESDPMKIGIKGAVSILGLVGLLESNEFVSPRKYKDLLADLSRYVINDSPNIVNI